MTVKSIMSTARSLVIAAAIPLLALAALAAPAHAQEQDSPAGVSISVEGEAVSESAATVELSGIGGSLTPGTEAALSWTVDGKTVEQRQMVSEDGLARFNVTGWKSVPVTGAWGSLSASATINFAPANRPITFPKGAPVPYASGREDPRAQGVGAHATVGRVSADVAQQMRGRSWWPGCVPISQLREVRVNYLGVDGYRYRGVLVARSDIAHPLAAAMTDLYGAGYRFHSMHPVDRYGKNPKGPGANDYASMRAGNTSVFNCRYVVGKERSRSWSPHMSGRAVDINPWENPYVARGGVHPDRYWLERRAQTPLGITSSGDVVKIMKRYGWKWGGAYGDYHHFDWRG